MFHDKGHPLCPQFPRVELWDVASETAASPPFPLSMCFLLCTSRDGFPSPWTWAGLSDVLGQWEVAEVPGTSEAQP